MNMAKQDRLPRTIIIAVFYVLMLHNSFTNAIQEGLITERHCILEAIDLYNQFVTKVCPSSPDPMAWLPNHCFHMCKASMLTDCAKGKNIVINLTISSTSENIYLPISKTESVKCSECNSIGRIVIICNIDSLPDIKDCSGLSSTASTRPKTTNDISTYSGKTTTPTTAASQESLPACKPCPLTSTVSSIATADPTTLKDISTTTTTTSAKERKCQNNETMPTNSLLGKQNEISIQYLAAVALGGIIVGAVFALLIVFLLKKRTTHFRSRLAEEHSMENPAYNKNHRFSDAFYNAHASQSEEYSEIQTNYYSRKSVNNNSAKTTQDSDYDHLNDAFKTDTNDQSMYDHAQYISKTHSVQQVEKENGDYTQTSAINVDRSYVEVTGEGSEGFVLDNQKQMGNVTNGHYFVLKKETN